MNSTDSIICRDETRKLNTTKQAQVSERSIGQIPLQPPPKHHRNIALETGRKAEQKESEDQDLKMKTVYPDSSRYDIVRGSVSKRDSNLSVFEPFTVEVLQDTVESLEYQMEKEIQKKIESTRKKYKKMIGPIKSAIYHKTNNP